jgi:ComF family protein
VPPLEHVTALVSGRRTTGWWRHWTGGLLDLLFPPFCPVCRASLDDDRHGPLCGRCWLALERIGPPWCRCCGKPLFGGRGLDITLALRQSMNAGSGGFGPGAEGQPKVDSRVGEGGSLCGACRLHRPAYSYARAAARYDAVVREALHVFKFRGRRSLAGPLGDLLADGVEQSLPLGRPDLLVPVPLHPRRARERGFNQALLLARRVGQAWERPVRGDVLLRIVATPSQTALAAPARRSNVRGAFRVRRPEAIAGRHVALVDDIVTTGATVSECARCLEESGAVAVGVLAVARVL